MDNQRAAQNPLVSLHEEQWEEMTPKELKKMAIHVSQKAKDDCNRNGDIELQDPTVQRATGSEPISGWSKFKVYKNLFGVSLSYFITFGVYLAEIGLQSSVNQIGGLGLASLCVLYFFFCVSCLYSSSLINILGTKYTMMVAYIAMTVYTVFNYYSSWYTLVPGSFLLGIMFGPLWASQAVHITNLAHYHASTIKKRPEQVVFMFFGIYIFIFKISYVPGNLISSVVLLNGRAENESIIDTSLDVCNNTEAITFDRVYYYVLLSIYVVLDLVAIVLLLFTVDRFSRDTKFSSKANFINVKPIVTTLKLFLNWKMIMIALIMVLDGYSISFVTGLFMKYYVSDCIGVYWVGFCQIAAGVGSAFSAIINGYLARVIPQYILVYIGAVVNLGALSFLMQWEREPSYYIVFLVLLGWGYSEGIWNSVPPSLAGTVFHNEDISAAQSISRMGMALGFMLGFLCAIVLEPQAMLWIELALIVIAVTGYSVLIFVTQPRDKLLPCCFKDQGGSIECRCRSCLGPRRAYVVNN